MGKIGWKTGKNFFLSFLSLGHMIIVNLLLQTSDIINVVNFWNTKELYFHSSFRNLSFSLPSCTYLPRPALRSICYDIVKIIVFSTFAWQFCASAYMSFKSWRISQIVFRKCNLPFGLLPQQILWLYHIV